MINLPIKAWPGIWESSRAWREITPIITKLLAWLAGNQAAEEKSVLGGWDASFLERLRVHHLLPLVFRKAASFGLESELPKAVWAEIRNSYLLALEKAVRQEAEIPLVLNALGRAGVEVIVLKGAEMRHRLYADPAVRPMEDLDLLIPRQELRKSRETLLQIGYLPVPEPRPGFAERFENEMLFHPGPGKYLKIDLHFEELRALGGNYRLPQARLAARAQTLDLAGVAAKVLAPEHALIHLSIHTFQDLIIFGPFAIPFVDLFLALRRLPVDWDCFLKESAWFRCQAPVYLMLRTMASLPGVQVPAEVLACLGEYRPSWREGLARRWGYLSLNLAALSQHRSVSDWTFFFWAKLWPQESYTRYHFGSAAARLRAFFKKFSPLNSVLPG